MNKVILRTRGPYAIEFAKDNVLDYYYPSEERVYFIDHNLAKFLESMNVDVSPILVAAALEIFSDEESLEVLDALNEFNSGLWQDIRNELLSQPIHNYDYNDDFLDEVRDEFGI